MNVQYFKVWRLGGFFPITLLAKMLMSKSVKGLVLILSLEPELDLEMVKFAYPR